jgi:ribonuclease HII
MIKIIGIDDAGRGPVLGPMILAGVLAEEKDNEIIQSWGAKDSKLLTPKKRAEIREKILTNFKNHIEISLPVEIDESSNLNYLEAIKTAMIINELSKNQEEEIKVFIDCPSTNIKSWSNDVQKLIKNPEKIILICEHKADLNHPIVSAASILAKEKRESELKKLKEELGIDFGSGYPADPKTKNFIKENFQNEKYAKIIRFSWKTIKKLFEGKSQEKLF